MMTEILLSVSIVLNIFLLYKQVPIWWAYCKEIKVDKELEKEIKEIENTGKANRIEHEITTLFLTLKQVKNITMFKSADGLDITVTTILKSRHYNSIKSLYKKQLQIHDMFPDVDIDFNIIFENNDD